VVSGESAVRGDIFSNWTVIIPLFIAKKTLGSRLFHMLSLLEVVNLHET
jgi:hypothetical protein